jgi:DNA-binding MarR family transcriptional regulator
MAKSRRRPKASTRSTGKKRKRAASAVDYSALAQFRHRLRMFLAFSEHAALKVGLPPQQHQAMLAIKGLAGPDLTSIGDLARILLIRHHTAVELTSRMTKLKLLTRTVDANDGRRVLLRLTAHGERKLEALSTIHLRELREIGPALVSILRQFRRSRKR